MLNFKDGSRLSSLLECYLDESATDGGTPVAVVGGLILQADAFYYLSSAWDKAIEKHQVGPSVHMKDFGANGRLKDFTPSCREKLFAELAKIIKEERNISIAATLSTADFKANFAGKGMLDIYSCCFLLLATAQGKHAEWSRYKYDIPFLMDDGNQYKASVVLAHDFLVNTFQFDHPIHVGSLAFGDDKKIQALQAADVIAWAVRRRSAGLSFKNGFEPLLELLDGPSHYEEEFKTTWMVEMSEKLDKPKR